MSKPSAPAHQLTTTQRTAIEARIKRIHTAGPLHSPESITAQDALLALVAEIVASAASEARDTALLEAQAAVDAVFATPSAVVARWAS